MTLHRQGAAGGPPPHWFYPSAGANMSETPTETVIVIQSNGDDTEVHEVNPYSRGYYGLTAGFGYGGMISTYEINAFNHYDFHWEPSAWDRLTGKEFVPHVGHVDKPLHMASVKGKRDRKAAKLSAAVNAALGR
jgi:hypothetical protein